MKRLFLLLAAVSVLTLGCSEADTVYPGDESFNNPSVPEGGVSSLTATVSNTQSVTNPYITITFDTNVDDASVIFDTTIQVEYPLGTPLTEGVGYDAIPNVITEPIGTIRIDLSPSSPVSLSSVRVILTSGLYSSLNNSITLTPANVTRIFP